MENSSAVEIAAFIAQRVADLDAITDARRRLELVADDLRAIDPDCYDPEIDEDYKIAEHHSFSMAELGRLQSAVEAVVRRAATVLLGRRVRR